MTDPVAEAAAKIAADAAPSSTEPSLLEKAMDTIHDLEAKVEHLIHPETRPNVATVALEATSGATVSATALASEGSEVPNVLPASASVTLPESASSADTLTTNGSATSSGGDAGNVEAVATASSLAESSTPSAPPLPEILTPSSASEVPNAAPAVVAQPAMAPSAEPVSMPAGIPGIVVSSPAEPVKLTPAATSAIRGGIANIKNHLSIRGFEQSAVADIHAELEAIEKWL